MKFETRVEAVRTRSQDCAAVFECGSVVADGGTSGGGDAAQRVVAREPAALDAVKRLTHATRWSTRFECPSGGLQDVVGITLVRTGAHQTSTR